MNEPTPPMSTKNVTSSPYDEDKVYLGDAVYAFHDGCGIWLTTENGVTVTNRIYLEPAVLASFERWVAHRVREGRQ